MTKPLTEFYAKASPEFQLLLHACQVYFDNTKKEAFGKALQTQPVDWKAVLHLTATHQIPYLLLQPLEMVGSPTVPDEVLNTLRQICKQIAFANLKNANELLRLLHLFEQEKLRVVPYKGALLAQTVYGNIGSRFSSDIDILIKRSDFAKIEQILLNEGYEPQMKISAAEKEHVLKYECEYNFNFYDNGKRVFHVEPHWMLINKIAHVSVSLEDLEAHLTPVQLSGRTVLALDPEATLMTLCIHHGIKDAWWMLKLICDIGAIVKQYQDSMNWEKLLRLSQQFGIQNSVLLGLFLAYRLVGTVLPTAILEKIQKLNAIQKASDKIIADLMQDTLILPADKHRLTKMLWNMKMRDRTSDKWGVFFSHLERIAVLTKRDYEFISLPPALHFLYYCIRPIRLLLEYGKRR